MKAVLSSVYAGNIQYFSILKNADEVLVDIYENFEKQSYRNRACIYGANGKLNMIIPLNRKGARTAMKNMMIKNQEYWQKLHWKSLESAYRSSPYFEFYEDEFYPIYNTKFDYLVEFNEAIQQKLINLIGIAPNLKYSSNYIKEAEDYLDYRKSIHPKVEEKEQFPSGKYIQVFEQRQGFIPNLSVFDLLFNEGPNSINYL